MDSHVIQNRDINIGPGAFKKLASDELLVFSIFYTIQGEGPMAGWPAVFVRLAGCNRGRKDDMGCRFCDTAFQYNQGKVMRFAEILAAMHETLVDFPKAAQPMVVITGGEPMMQNNVGSFCYFLSKYNGWKNIQIESNGDRVVAGLPAEVVLVVSPKVSRGKLALEQGFTFDRGDHANVVLDMSTYEYKEPNQAVFDRANFFKFVVDANPDSPYHQVPSWADSCGRPVYVSPLTHYARPVAPGEVATAWNARLVDVPRTRDNYAHAAALATRHGYRVSMQQHLFYGVP